MKIPNAESAFVDIVKLRDYSLNPEQRRENIKHAFSQLPWDWPSIMPNGYARNYWRLRRPGIAGSEGKRSLGRGI